MAKLTNDIARTYELGDTSEYPMLGGEFMYEGAGVGIKSNGYAPALQTGDKFAGFADERVDNTSGTDGQKTIRTKFKGTVVLPAPSGVSLTDVGSNLFASDDNTFTITSASTPYIGKIRRISDNEIIVDFQAFADAVPTA